MDTRNLVVGQEVYMESGIYCSKGNVVEVTPKGVVVQLWTYCADGTRGKDTTGNTLKFDINGMGCDDNWRYDKVPGTFECGPWEIKDTPEYLLDRVG
jgi:hypothetical protein